MEGRVSAMNWIKTFLLMGMMTAIIVLVGDLIGHTHGMVIAFVIAGAMNLVSYWYSDKIVLAMYRAKPVSETEAPQLYGMIERLTRQAGMPMPKLYLIDMDVPNAFATGRDPEHAAVAVTSGLMRILDQSEVEGVVAHELAHVKNRDILIGTIAATMAGAVMLLARMAQLAAIFGGGRSDDREGGGIGLLVVAIVAPIAALMVQMAISRSREFQADATGAQISGKPLNLANALLKLERGNEMIPGEVEPSTAHMFIVNPLHGGIGSLFSTHPPIPARVERLRAMAEQPSTYQSE
jgi:heat shock protein HtpX